MIREDREHELQFLVAQARAFREVATRQDVSNMTSEVLHYIGEAYEAAAVRLNTKWQLHESISHMAV